MLHQDVVALARAMLTVPNASRAGFAEMIVQLSHAADRHRKNTFKAHPIFGDGTLASCCSGYPKAPERRLDDPDYGECLITALETIVNFRLSRQPRAQERHKGTDGS